MMADYCHLQNSAPSVSANLGARRSSFREKVFASPEEYQANRDWFYGHATNVGFETKIYFPVGISSARYYLSGKQVAHRNGRTTEQLFLVYETLTEGVVNLEWKVDVDSIDMPAKDAYDSAQGLGTIERMLARQGLFIRQPVPENAERELSKVEGLACYEYMPEVLPRMHYYFVSGDGVPARDHLLKLEVPKPIGIRVVPPPFTFPLPVSPEEIAAISKAKHS